MSKASPTVFESETQIVIKMITVACTVFSSRFKSTLAVILQRRMKELVAKHPHVKPPPFVKRRPKPIPKNLAKGLEPVEVCDLNKYVYLG